MAFVKFLLLLLDNIRLPRQANNTFTELHTNNLINGRNIQTLLWIYVADCTWARCVDGWKYKHIYNLFYKCKCVINKFNLIYNILFPFYRVSYHFGTNFLRKVWYHWYQNIHFTIIYNHFFPYLIYTDISYPKYVAISSIYWSKTNTPSSHPFLLCRNCLVE